MRNKTLEQWKNIYGIMKEIKSLKPWNYLYNDIPVIIKNVFPEDIYVTVLDNGENVFGLIIYPDEYEFYKAYCQYNRPCSEPETVLYNHNSIVGIWGNKDDLSEENRDLLKSLGIRFRGDGNWLHFESYGKRYLPAFLTQKQVGYLYKAAVALRDIFSDFSNISGDLFDMCDAVHAVLDKKSKSFGIKLVKYKYDPANCLVLDVEENESIQRVRDLPQKKYEAQINIKYALYPKMLENGEIGFEEAFVSCDAETGECLGVDINLDELEEPAFLFNSIAAMCGECGKPARIIVCDRYIEKTISDFCAKTGIKLEYTDEPLTKLDVIYDDINAQANEMAKDFLDFMQKNDLDIEDMTEAFNEYMSLMNGGEPHKNITVTKGGLNDDNGEYSFKISVSLSKGCYRHLTIPADFSFGQLHELILKAFNFDDDHLYSFYLDNKPYSKAGELCDPDGSGSDYSLSIGDYLSVGQKFIFLFDFGDNWCFRCKVLDKYDKKCENPTVSHSVGDAPAQYGE